MTRINGMPVSPEGTVDDSILSRHRATSGHQSPLGDPIGSVLPHHPSRVPGEARTAGLLPVTGLTDAEARAVSEVAIHGSQKEAATCLGVSIHTIKNQAASVLAKTKASTMAQAFLALGWLELPE